MSTELGLFQGASIYLFMWNSMVQSFVRKIISVIVVGLSQPIGLQSAPNSACQTDLSLHSLLPLHCSYSKFSSGLLKTGQNSLYMALFRASLLTLWTRLLCKEPLSFFLTYLLTCLLTYLLAYLLTYLIN